MPEVCVFFFKLGVMLLMILQNNYVLSPSKQALSKGWFLGVLEIPDPPVGQNPKAAEHLLLVRFFGLDACPCLGVES